MQPEIFAVFFHGYNFFHRLFGKSLRQLYRFLFPFVLYNQSRKCSFPLSLFLFDQKKENKKVERTDGEWKKEEEKQSGEKRRRRSKSKDKLVDFLCGLKNPKRDSRFDRRFPLNVIAALSLSLSDAGSRIERPVVGEVKVAAAVKRCKVEGVDKLL